MSAILAAPAAATTVLSETWGRPTRGDLRYSVTATEAQEAMGGSTIVGRFSFDNCWCAGSGHSRIFSGSLFDGETDFPSP